MSGGIAYVWDPEGAFPKQCNGETFELEGVADANDIEELHALVKKHYLYTESDVAKRLMDDWDLALTQFVKVMPTDYKRVLAERAVTAA